MSARHPGTALVRAAGALVLEPILLFQAQAGEDLVAAFYRLFGEKNMESGKTYTACDEKDNRFELRGHTELFWAVYGGSACYLRVPKDLVEKVRTESQRQELEGCDK